MNMKKQLLFFVVALGILHSTNVSALSWPFKRKTESSFTPAMSSRFEEPIVVSNQDLLYQRLNRKRQDLDIVRRRKAYFGQMQQLDELNKEQQKENRLLQEIQQIEAALKRAGAPV